LSGGDQCIFVFIAMSSELYLEYLRSLSVDDNPYFNFYKRTTGKGSIGGIYRNEPDFQQGYGVTVRRSKMRKRSQLGGGIGSWFSNLFRMAQPYLKSGLKTVLNVGSNIARDVIDGENVKSAFKKRVKAMVSAALPPQLSNIVNKTIGSGKSCGSKRKSVAANKRCGVKKSAKRRKLKTFPGLNLIP
jgi:hypothetical protein